MDKVYTLRETIKSLTSKMEKSKGNPPPNLASELSSAQSDLQRVEAELATLKRDEVRSALRTAFKAYEDLGKKIEVLGKFGQYLADQIPIVPLGAPVGPFQGKTHLFSIFFCFLKALFMNKILTKFLSPFFPSFFFSGHRYDIIC